MDPKDKKIPKHISQVFKEIPQEEGEFDFFNTNLLYDTPAFLDPFLLKNSPVEKERKIFDRFGIFFKEAYKMSLQASIKPRELKKLENFLSFKEPIEVYLGYTADSNYGKGLKADFAKKLVNFFINSSINRLVVKDEVYPDEKFNPSILALIAEGLGYDGVSDLSICLIMDYLIEYTQEQCKKWGIKCKKKMVRQTFDFDEMEWTNGIWAELPENPLDKGTIIFVPKHLLRGDEKIDPNKAKSKIISILREDDQLKERFAGLVGKRISEIKLEEIHNAINQDNTIVKRYLEELEKEGFDGYDFEKDVLGFMSVKTYKDHFNKKFPKEVSIDKCEDLLKYTKELIDTIKEHFSEEAWKDMWVDLKNMKPGSGNCKESVFGRKIHGMGVAYFKHLPDVTFIREAGSGGGFVDFIVIFKRCRIAIEVKNLCNNSKSGEPPLEAYLHGIQRQLPAYAISSKCIYAFYITGQHYNGLHCKTKRKIKIRDDTPRAQEIKNSIPDIEKEIKSKFSDFEELFYENIPLYPQDPPSKK
jgi:hypothetical protein